MSDWRLDELTWDLVIDETTNWDLELLTGLEYYAQKIKIKLLFYLGEWFLDTSLGVDWFGVVLVKSPNLITIDNLLKITVTEEPFVIKIDKWKTTFDKPNRVLTIVAQIETDEGTLEINEGIPV
jgi:hypothetical protein